MLLPYQRTYRHYGSSKFQKEMMNSVVCNRWIKPLGGLWASSTDSNCGWKYFCEKEHFATECLSSYFDFQLTRKAKIFCIDDIEDLLFLVDMFPGEQLDDLARRTFEVRQGDEKICINCYPDWMKMSRMYDGVEVNISRDFRLYKAMNGWDVDSLVVWNSDVVIPV